MIKEASRKTKAEVDFEINIINEEELEESQCIPFLGSTQLELHQIRITQKN